MTTRAHFQTEIMALRTGLVEMASLVLSQVERAVAAWDETDPAAAAEVTAADERIDDRCLELDQKVFSLQLLEQPVASDLRLLHVGLIASSRSSGSATWRCPSPSWPGRSRPRAPSRRSRPSSDA